MTLEILRAISERPEALVLCTVLAVKGSAPRHPGSKLLVDAAGPVLGSVGGGRGEAMVLAACREVLAGGAARVLTIDMQGLEAEGPDMVCGGTSRILLEPLGGRGPYRKALAILERGERALLVKRLATAEVIREGADPERARAALESGHPFLDETAGLFYDPLLPPDKLLILGGGYVGRALAALAPALGFAVTVADDRDAFLGPERFPPGVATLSGGYTEAVARFPIDPSTYVVIVSRGHLCDLECVRAVLGRPYRYAGFMGSLRKVRLVLDQVRADGRDPAEVDALCAPIGFEIGAETPEELAVAIAAELIAARRRAPAAAAAHQARKARRLG